MALIVGGQTVTTDETGTNKLDASQLFGNLPAIDGGSLTGITSAPTNVEHGLAAAGAGSSASVTAPNPGVAFIWFPQVGGNASDQGGANASTIGSAKDGGTATASNWTSGDGGTSYRARWVKISY